MYNLEELVVLLNKDRTLEEVTDYLKRERVEHLLAKNKICFVNLADNDQGSFVRVFQDTELVFAVKCESLEEDKHLSRMMVVAALLDLGYKVEHPHANK